MKGKIRLICEKTARAEEEECTYVYEHRQSAHRGDQFFAPSPREVFFKDLAKKIYLSSFPPPQTFSGFFLCKSFYDRICIPYAWHVKYEDNLSKKLTDKRDTSGAKIDIFLFLNSYLSIILRTPMFLESPISTKSPPGVNQIAKRYWPNHQPVLTNLTIHTYKLCISFLSTF